jgi:hypothetical protein
VEGDCSRRATFSGLGSNIFRLATLLAGGNRFQLA